MKKTVLTFLSLIVVLFSFAQNLTKVKEAINSKKYNEAKTMLDEFLNNAKYQNNIELYYLKAKLYSEIVADPAQEQSYNEAFSTSLSNFSKVAEKDTLKLSLFNELDNYQALTNLYAVPYNKGIKSLESKEYEKSLGELQQADMAGRFIYRYGQRLSALDTALNFYIGLSALLSGKEDLAASYFTKLADANVNNPGYEDVYKNLMMFHFNKNNLDAFEKTRQQGLKFYPKEEYFTYDDIIFINDMKDETEKLKRIEAKVNTDPKNIDALSLYSELLFDKLVNDETAYPTEQEYTAAETKLVKLYESMAELMPEDGGIIYNAGLIYINKAFKINSKISDVNDKIRKFNESQKPDKAGKIPPPPKELTAARDELRAKQQAAFDMGLPYVLKAQPSLEKKSAAGKREMQTYKKLVDILIEVYNSKRQAAKLPADKAKFEAEENKWNKEYERINSISK